VRFTDFLRTAVLLFAGSATALAIVAIAGAQSAEDDVLIYVAVGWWLIATLVGLWLGRAAAISASIGRMLAQARATPALPEQEPGGVVFNRLWALGLFTLVAGGLAFLVPQVPAIATGYALILALAWRRQPQAVKAIEERDGVQFYIERSSPFRPTKLVKVPGLRKAQPTDPI
jgi:hypothetical protein